MELSTGVSIQWRFYRLLDIQKLLLSFFNDKEAMKCLLYCTFAFWTKPQKVKQNLCQLSRMGIVQGKDGTSFDLFFTRIVFLPFTIFWSLIFQFDFMLPEQRACVGTGLLRSWNLHSHWCDSLRRIKTNSSSCCYRQLILKPKLC